MKKRISWMLVSLVIITFSSFIYFNYEDIFSNPKITGDVVSSRLVIVTENQSICDAKLEEGWNLVSFPCLSDDVDADFILGSLDYGSYRYYDPNDASDPWKSYNPNVPSWVRHDVSKVSKTKGYWINMNAAENMSFNSTLSIPTLIDLVPGWNMIGYPSRNMSFVNVTLNSLIPNFDYVYMYNASAFDKWKEWTWNSSLPSNQDLVYMHRNYGYWIYMLNSDTLTIIE